MNPRSTKPAEAVPASSPPSPEPPAAPAAGSPVAGTPEPSPTPTDELVASLVVSLTGLARAGYPVTQVLDAIRDVLAKAQADEKTWTQQRLLAAIVPIVDARFRPVVWSEFIRLIALQLIVAVRSGASLVKHNDADFMGT